ncbi:MULTISPECIES: hypothetical protein [Pseudomonadaceae]|uniref:DUF3742 domain-containing protein n=1 Tax=Pseudomonas gessardii TaxID=78544 RepID=A0A7Y1MMN1_9PSED|nr:MULTISPECIES: hypothetical protein [Pseudomonadaceae]MCQ4322634.1 hypothetical protein [Stutzerimonas stutzeri]NNA94963.1 hypothetical protein [Pseudomonas gessardii]
MTTQTSQGVAGRLGYGLGQIVRLVWFSQNRTVRWVKRLALIAFAVYSWVWLAHAFMAVLTVGLILLALAVGDFSPRYEGGSKQVFGVGWQDGPDGWGYYDMYGNCHTFGDDDE